MTKGIANSSTNIKPMAGGAAIAVLQPGEYVYGEKGTTDITGFTHYYRANKTLVPLNTPCKATLANLILSNEVEPGIPPIDPPPDEEFEPYFILEKPNGARKRYNIVD